MYFDSFASIPSTFRSGFSVQGQRASMFTRAGNQGDISGMGADALESAMQKEGLFSRMPSPVSCPLAGVWGCKAKA